MAKTLNQYLKYLIECLATTFYYNGDRDDFRSNAYENILNLYYDSACDDYTYELHINVELDKKQGNFVFQTVFTKAYDDIPSTAKTEYYTEKVPVLVIEQTMLKNYALSEQGSFLDDRGKEVLQPYLKKMLIKMHQRKNIAR